MAGPVQRPSPARWVLYAFGAGLPARQRNWVLFDVTTRTWVVRHLLRSLVQIVPFAVVLYLVIPGDPTIRLVSIVMGTIVGFAYSAAFVEASTEHRAVKAGFPEGFAEEIRQRRARRRR